MDILGDSVNNMCELTFCPQVYHFLQNYKNIVLMNNHINNIAQNYKSFGYFILGGSHWGIFGFQISLIGIYKT